MSFTISIEAVTLENSLNTWQWMLCIHMQGVSRQRKVICCEGVDASCFTASTHFKLYEGFDFMIRGSIYSWKYAHMRTLNRTSLKTQASLVYLERRGGRGKAAERNWGGRLGRGKEEKWRAKDGNRIGKQGARKKRMLNQEGGRERESTGEKSGARYKWQAAERRERGNINKSREKNSLVGRRGVGMSLFKHQGTPL